MTKNYTPADFMRAPNWVKDNGGDMFPTPSSWDWFKRKHKDELIASGELISRRGTGGDLVGPRIGEVAVEIMRRSHEEDAA